MLAILRRTLLISLLSLDVLLSFAVRLLAHLSDLFPFIAVCRQMLVALMMATLVLIFHYVSRMLFRSAPLRKRTKLVVTIVFSFMGSMIACAYVVLPLMGLPTESTAMMGWLSQALTTVQIPAIVFFVALCAVGLMRRSSINVIVCRRRIAAEVINASSVSATTPPCLPDNQVEGETETATPVFDTPSINELEDGDVPLGKVMREEKEVCSFNLSLEDLMHQTVIVGETSFAKTKLIMKLLQGISNKGLAWTLIEMKGEYKPLVKLLDDVVYLKPCSAIAPLRINIFDPQMENPRTYTSKVFTILKETFSTLFTDENRGLSAQMERVFYGALESYISTPRGSSKSCHGSRIPEGSLELRIDRGNEGINTTRSWTGFNEWLLRYAQKHAPIIPQLKSRIQALLNRLSFFTGIPLGEIFDHEQSIVNFADMMRRKMIIDLSEVRAKGTLEDTQLLTNIIVKCIAAAAKQREADEEPKHILVVDGGLDIMPETSCKKITTDPSISDWIGVLQRATGQGVIASIRRPNISQNILANATTKIFLRTNSDGEKAARMANLNEEQATYLKTMPKGEAIVITPKHPNPVRIRAFEMNLPKVSTEDIIANNMMNYPLIYDTDPTTIKRDHIPQELYNTDNHQKHIQPS